MDVRQELNAELRRARGWLIAVGVIMFAIDMIFMFGVDPESYDASGRALVIALDGTILALFLALAWFTPRRPRLCLILGLVLFWGIQLWSAVEDPKSLTQGLILKVFFTVALVRGLKNATRAEHLKEDLAKVFE